MEREPDHDLYRDPEESQIQRLRDAGREESERRRADGELDDAVGDAVRSEELSRDADHARHIAETSDDPGVRRRAQAWAYEAADEADIAESRAWRGFRAAEIDDRASDLESSRVTDPDGPEYDSPQRRQQLTEQLQSHGIEHEVVASRVRADVGQARPATAINPRRNNRARILRSRVQPRIRETGPGGRSR